jgi:hypothetical protein
VHGEATRLLHSWSANAAVSDGRRDSRMDPNPDYDASDEVEYFFNWLPWALRGVYPPPAYPPV